MVSVKVPWNGAPCRSPAEHVLSGGQRQDHRLADADDPLDTRDYALHPVDHAVQTRCQLVDLVDGVAEPLEGDIEVAGGAVQVVERLAQAFEDGVDLLDGDVGVQGRLRELPDPLPAGPYRRSATLSAIASV